MSSTYSTNLALSLIDSGTEAGNWGTITNTNLGTLLEQALSGYTTQAVTAGVTTTLSMDNGASCVARNMYIELTGGSGAGATLVLPNNKKLYYIKNNTTSISVTVKTAAQATNTAPVLLSGRSYALVCDGTIVNTAFDTIPDSTLGTYSFNITRDLNASGTTTISGLNTFTGSTTFSNLVVDFSGVNQNITIAPTGTGFIYIDASGADVASSGIDAMQIGTITPAVGIFTSAQVTGGSSANYGLANPGGNTLGFYANSILRGSASTTGAWSINAPTSAVVAFTVNGIAGTHSTQIADSANVKYNAGYLETPISTQTGAYTAVLADSGKTVYYTGSTSVSLTIPSNASVAYPTGTVLTFINDASAAVSVNIAITTDTLQWASGGSTGTRTLARYGMATAVKVTSTKWVISGTGLT